MKNIEAFDASFSVFPERLRLASSPSDDLTSFDEKTATALATVKVCNVSVVPIVSDLRRP